MRWISPQNWHITLHFIGEVPADIFQDILASVRSASSAVEPFELIFRGVAPGPPGKSSSMLWGIFHEHACFVELAHLLHETVSTVVPQDPLRRTPFPHITLARVQGRPIRGLILPSPGITPLPLPVEEIVLYRSHLGRGNPRYQVLERFALRGGSTPA